MAIDPATILGILTVAERLAIIAGDLAEKGEFTATEQANIEDRLTASRDRLDAIFEKIGERP